MRFFVGRRGGLLRMTAGFCWREDSWWRFAVENAGGAGCCGKAAAEPPHFKMGGARAVVDAPRCGLRRASRLAASLKRSDLFAEFDAVAAEAFGFEEGGVSFAH
jgi:hypothetical protein